MSPEMQLLIMAAAGIALLHTLTGPDHYVPFIALARARQWSVGKTVLWTIICGCGHVWSSILLALVGAALGWSLSKLQWAEQVRGGLAGWALLCFGMAYALWGLVKSRQNSAHKHFDMQPDGSMYVFEHRHAGNTTPTDRFSVTPWVMFVIFVLGPCEPMIPLLYFPGAQQSGAGMLALIGVYTLVTLATMVSIVLMGYFGILQLNKIWLERHMHLLAGLTLSACGAGMLFMGW